MNPKQCKKQQVGSKIRVDGVEWQNSPKTSQSCSSITALKFQRLERQAFGVNLFSQFTPDLNKAFSKFETI
jgi:hypothetical protein